MTISSTNRKAGPFDGNDSTTDFPFTFKVFAEDDVYVAFSDGTTESTLTKDSDYTVTLNSDQDNNPGGTITYPVTGDPLADGETLVIAGSLSEVQGVDIENGGPWNPVVVTNALDYLTILVQQLREVVSRTFRVNITSGMEPELPTPEGGKAFGWNALGTAIINYTLQAGTSLVDLASTIGSSLIGFLPAGTGARHTTVQEKLRETVSLFAFDGPVGTDIREAFCSVMAYANQAVVAAGDPNYITTNTCTIEIPDGNWTWAGAPCEVVDLNVAIKQNRTASRITMSSGDYLLKVSGAINSFEWDGAHIDCDGGPGVLRATSTAANTKGHMAWTNFYIFGFIEAAVSWKFSDYPFWHFGHGVMRSKRVAGNTVGIGVATSGITDGATLDRVSFEDCYFGLKLGVGSNGNGATGVIITSCEWYRFPPDTGTPNGDIWIVPGTAAPSANSTGVVRGFTFAHNKHGSDHLRTTDYRILIAEETSEFVANTSAASDNFIGNLVVRDADVWGTGASCRALVYSMTPNVWNSDIDLMSSGTPVGALEFYEQPASDALTCYSSTNRIRCRYLAGPAYELPAPSTYYAGPVDDPLGLQQGFTNVGRHYMTGQDASWVELCYTDARDFTPGALETLTNVTDMAGGNDAARVNMGEVGGYTSCTILAPTSNRLGYIVVDLKQAAADSVTAVQVIIQNGGSTKIPFVTTVPLKTYWDTYVFPFCASGVNTADITNFAIIGISYDGTHKHFEYGRVRVGHASTPPATGLRMLDTGLVAWEIGTIAAVTAGNAVTIDLGGVAPGDTCLASYNKPLDGVFLYANCLAANQVQVIPFNTQAAPRTPDASGKVRLLVFKKR